MVSTHKLNRLFLGKRNVRTNSAVQGGPPGGPNPPWVAPPPGQSKDRLGYDGAGRMISKRYKTSDSGNPVLVGFTTKFDRASNKLYERALHAENRSHLYEPYDAVSNLPSGGYDSLDRILQYQRGTLSSTGGDGGNGGGSIAVSGSTPLYINLSGTDLQRSYTLDGLGNWRNTIFTPSTTGTPTPQTEIRQQNLLNEITRINNPAALTATINPTYDLNGNLTSAGTPAYSWDALNRLATASPGGAYYYDALNRRVSKTVSDVQTDFIYSGWRCVEDRNPGAEDGDGPIAQYVWGRYLDELLQITTLVYITTGSGDSPTTYSPGTYFPLQDMLYRTTATVTITEEGVAIVEAFDFDAYANTLIFNAPDTGPNWWGPDAQQSPNSLCQFLFTGQRFDAETGLYYYKRRMYSAGLGRFLSRDPIGVAGDLNLNSYTRGRPSTFSDPMGLCNKGDKIGLSRGTYMVPGVNANPDQANFAMNLAIIAAASGDILKMFPAGPENPTVEKLISEVFDAGETGHGLEIAKELAELKMSLKNWRGITGTWATIWTKVQCFECDCSNWFTGWPFYRDQVDFDWYRSGGEHWVQCDINKTTWGTQPNNRNFLLGKPGPASGGFGYAAVSLSELATMKTECEKQAEDTCK